MMRLAVDDPASSGPRWRPRRGGGMPRLVLCGLILAGVPACAVEAPPGEPIDFGALPSFKPFELRTLDGERRVLADFLDGATLISFFFPT